MYEIILTPKAKDTFISIILFIRIKWGDRPAKKFVDRAYKVLDIISGQPYIFKAYQETNVRKGFITKHTSMVYRIGKDRIEVLFFWDNRQEPVV